MFERISNGWAAVKSSWRVLMCDKELVLFPIFSSVACLVILASYATPFILNPNLLDSVKGEKWNESPIGLLLGFTFYFCNYFVMVFFNSALVACALIRFSGGNPTVGDGFRASFSRLPQIFAWALVGGTIGWILKLIEERSSWIGQIIVSFIGAAWAIATYFVVPVLVAERRSPFEALKRSTSIVAKTWGESIVGNISISFIMFFVTIPGVMLLVGAAILAGVSQTLVLPILLGVTGFLWIIGCSVVGMAMNGILVAALYRYASQGEAPANFDEHLLHDSFRAKG